MYWSPVMCCGLIIGYNLQGSHPTWKTVKPGILSFMFPGLEFAQKVEKRWKFNSKPGGKKLEIYKFSHSIFTFQNVICKKNEKLHLCLIYIINTNTVLKPYLPVILLLYLEITLKIHGILCHLRSGNPALATYTVHDVISYPCDFSAKMLWNK